MVGESTAKADRVPPWNWAVLFVQVEPVPLDVNTPSAPPSKPSFTNRTGTQLGEALGVAVGEGVIVGVAVGAIVGVAVAVGVGDGHVPWVKTCVVLVGAVGA